MNRLVSVSGGASFVYDGDGNRIKKTENGQINVYVNRYYEKNVTTSEVTTSYYLVNKLIAQRKNTTLNYLMQDALGSTSVALNSSDSTISRINYFSFGATRSTDGTLPTDHLFTGQRLDQTGLYYYGARYYDASIGKFISPDTVVPDPANPQNFNRYSYCLNNPLKYNDPTGHFSDDPSIELDREWRVRNGESVYGNRPLIDDPRGYIAPSRQNDFYLAKQGAHDSLDGLGMIPVGGEIFDGANSILYLIDGDYGNALLSACGMVPFAGWFATGGKWAIKAEKGYDSFKQLKQYVGLPGEGKVWHHIVEQCQEKPTRSGFNARLIQNPSNVLAVDKATNDAINTYYSSKPRFTNGKTVRDWLNGQSFEEQYNFGIKVLKDLGVKW